MAASANAAHSVACCVAKLALTVLAVCGGQGVWPHSGPEALTGEENWRLTAQEYTDLCAVTANAQHTLTLTPAD